MAVFNDLEKGQVLKLTYQATYKALTGTPHDRQKQAWAAVAKKARELENQ